MSNDFKMSSLIAQLRTVAFFAGLKGEVLDDLARHALWREYAPGEVVFLEGEPASGLYLLRHGWLKAVKSSPEGREQVLRFIGPGETFNEAGVFANWSLPATVYALEPAGAWLLQRDAILRLLRERPDFAENVLENMARRVIDLVDLVADLSLRPVTGRLARLLLETADGDELLRPRWYTQAELAARLGTVPDVIQRAMRGLDADGVIEVDRQRIRICDREALEALAA
ncbi:MAG: Crp/Fnr family transcriptional regulator [Anaerolineae bacterium]|nr:Crp/Fnr family transcriptional regulator [Anaerolineae bacterium]